MTNWVQVQGGWEREMVNQSHKDKIRQIRYSPDGTLLLLLLGKYSLVLGTVEGDKIWSVEEKFNIDLIEWSPLNDSFIIVSEEGEVRFYDLKGCYLFSLQAPNLGRAKGFQIYLPGVRVHSVNWDLHFFDGSK